MSPAEALGRAREALAARNPAEAERHLRSVPEGAPEYGEARHLLALVVHRRGDSKRAAELLEAAMGELSVSGEAWSHLAEIRRVAGDVAGAIVAGRRAVELLPQWPPALNNLALALDADDRLEEAEALLRRAVERDAGYARGWYNLGNVSRRRHHPEDAERCLREAIRLVPRYPKALNALGVVLGDRGRSDEAAAAYERAVRLAPRDPKPLLNYGNLLASRQRPAEALRCYDHALRLDREYVEAWLAKSSLLQREERWQGAIEAARRASRLRPEDPEGPFRLGQVHVARHDYPGALAAFRRAVELDPEHRGAVCALAQIRGEVCDWSERERELQAVCAAIEDARAAGDPCPMPPFVAFLPFAPEVRLHLARAEADRLWNEAAGDREAMGAPPVGPPAPGRRLKLGYLSSDFRNHAMAHHTRSLWPLHDRSLFEVAAYSLGPDDGSPYRRGIAADCDRFVDLREATDLEAARRIRDDGVDILIDLVGYTRGARAGIPARRPAPLQVSWLYAGSMGGRSHDYFVGDPVVSPPEHAGRYGEALCLLPHCYFVTDHHQPIAEATPARADEGLPEQGFVLACFNKLAKVDPEIFDIWMRILAAVPGSVLWFVETAPARDNLRREAERRGIDGERLRFGGIRDKPLHLARHRLAGLLLDTWVYGGHTTATDALWAGLPVLTCLGDDLVSRVCAAMLRAVGLPELVMPDLAAYERRAIELATDPGALAGVRERLAANRTVEPLFDTPRFVRNLERAYLAMWDRLQQEAEPGLLVIEEEPS